MARDFNQKRKLSDLFIRYARKAGLEGVTFHCLRDTFISWLAVDPTVSAAKLMKLARHRDFKTTQRYLKIEEADLRAAVIRLDENETGTHTGTEKMTGSEFLDLLGISGQVEATPYTPPPPFQEVLKNAVCDSIVNMARVWTEATGGEGSPTAPVTGRTLTIPCMRWETVGGSRVCGFRALDHEKKRHAWATAS